MSRIYDALKRAAAMQGQRQDSAGPSSGEERTTRPPAEPGPVAAVAPAAAAPPPPGNGRPLDPLREGLKAALADRSRAEVWLHVESETLRQLGLGPMPSNGGRSAWLLESVGGVALGILLASVSALVNFFVVVSLLHIRIPKLF